MTTPLTPRSVLQTHIPCALLGKLKSSPSVMKQKETQRVQKSQTLVRPWVLVCGAKRGVHAALNGLNCCYHELNKSDPKRIVYSQYVVQRELLTLVCRGASHLTLTLGVEALMSADLKPRPPQGSTLGSSSSRLPDPQ